MKGRVKMEKKKYNSIYTEGRHSRIAYPLGGIGAGMFCIEGTGQLSHFSLRNSSDLNNTPTAFSALCVKSKNGNIARVLEDQVPTWKIFSRGRDGQATAGTGLSRRHYGLPRFAESSFKSRFPFGTVQLNDPDIPVDVSMTGWSPFTPLNADDSSLPVAGLEFTFTNKTDEKIELVYSFNAANFMACLDSENHRVLRSEVGTGFVLDQPAIDDEPWKQGAFSVVTDQPQAKVDCAWFRGDWYDPLTMIWNDIASGNSHEKPPLTEGKPSPGASLFVPLEVQPQESKTINIMLSWYVPETNFNIGVFEELQQIDQHEREGIPEFHKPWYAGKFSNISEVSEYWLSNYARLRRESSMFSDTFYSTTMPDEVVEAVAANLSILKSPTVLRQTDGRLWGWEGSLEEGGSCHGTCTHVWNYAQAVAHLFPELERSIRYTEFNEGQDERGHQNFRVPLPIQPADHEFYAASDGQLGGIMKVYRDWRISGDTAWLKTLWPQMKQSLHYCITTWDPDRTGVLIEPHHNTYDIEFWGPNGMCTSIYLGALKAASLIADELGEKSDYAALYDKGRQYMESELFNGEYFEHKVIWEGLRAPLPTNEVVEWNVDYTPKAIYYSSEALQLLEKEGPKYQYGKGCLSDGVIGAWFAEMCGLGDILDPAKVKSHLLSVYKYNLRRDLTDHVNPQRSGFALGQDGGLLLCTWPKGGKPSLPFVYSNEVWTGIEYQVASHLLSFGCIEEGLDIVRTCRDRYDGRIRNPFNEYECGNWYVRAMASYGLIQGWSGIRYDALDKTLYVSPKLSGNYSSFLCTAHGYGIAGMQDGKPFVNVIFGEIDIENIEII